MKCISPSDDERTSLSGMGSKVQCGSILATSSDQCSIIHIISIWCHQQTLHSKNMISTQTILWYSFWNHVETWKRARYFTAMCSKDTEIKSTAVGFTKLPPSDCRT